MATAGNAMQPAAGIESSGPFAREAMRRKAAAWLLSANHRSRSPGHGAVVRRRGRRERRSPARRAGRHRADQPVPACRADLQAGVRAPAEPQRHRGHEEAGAGRGRNLVPGNLERPLKGPEQARDPDAEAGRIGAKPEHAVQPDRDAHRSRLPPQRQQRLLPRIVGIALLQAVPARQKAEQRGGGEPHGSHPERQHQERPRGQDIVVHRGAHSGRAGRAQSKSALCRGPEPLPSQARASHVRGAQPVSSGMRGAGFEDWTLVESAEQPNLH